MTDQDQKAIMNPHHEKKNTLPYLSKGLRTGIERAFPLAGLTSGACQSVWILNIVGLVQCPRKDL